MRAVCAGPVMRTDVWERHQEKSKIVANHVQEQPWKWLEVLGQELRACQIQIGLRCVALAIEDVQSGTEHTLTAQSVVPERAESLVAMLDHESVVQDAFRERAFALPEDCQPFVAVD